MESIDKSEKNGGNLFGLDHNATNGTSENKLPTSDRVHVENNWGFSLEDLYKHALQFYKGLILNPFKMYFSCEGTRRFCRNN